MVDIRDQCSKQHSHKEEKGRELTPTYTSLSKL